MARLPLTLAFFAVHVLLFFFFFSSPRVEAAGGSDTSSEQIFINCGASGNLTDDFGRVWSGDKDSRILSGTRELNPSTQASAPNLPFATARIFPSTFTYSIPVTGERYFVRLYFYPADYGNFSSSAAVFDVSCSSYTLLKNFSTAYYADALNQEYFVREYSINASSASAGWVNLTFTPSSNVSASYAFVNGIELVAMPFIFGPVNGSDPLLLGPNSPYRVDPGSALETMYRLNVGGSPLSVDKDSGKLFRQWSDDTRSIAGSGLGIAFAKDSNVSIRYPASVPQYIAPADVYGTARSMGWYDDTNLNYNMSWILPVDPGFYYLVRLHYCEIQYPFTLKNQRVFTVYVNNLTALQDMDVIVYSGGIGVPVYLDYVTVFVEGGKQVDLWVSLNPYIKFKPQYTNVILNGLEVFKINVGNNLAGLMPEPRSRENKNVVPGAGGGGGGSAGVIGGVVGGVVGVVLIGCLVFFFCCRRGRKTGDGGKDPDGLPLSMTSSGSKTATTVSYGSSLPSNLCRHFTFAEIQAATKGFDEKLQLGVGGFGKVYRGIIDQGATTVAIKRANPMSQQGIHEFQNEIEMLSKLRHRHLVSLIGYCEENGEMILVYDYMAKGTLREHLYKSKNPTLSWKQRLEICIGAARGLHYLHTGAKYTIIHRDVKTTNILLDDNLVAKVSDFGLSKTGPSLENTHVSTVVKGSFGYLDPEYFRRQQLTEKSDVYSFGVVLFEVLCARPALMKDLPKEQVSLADWAVYCQKKGVLEDIIDPHLRAKIAPQCLKKFAETAEKCLSEVGQDRPPMGDVLWNLEFALQLQETAESKGEVEPWTGKGEEAASKDLYDPLSDPKMQSPGTGTTTTSTSMGMDERSIASVDSDGLTPSTVFSQIMDPKGR